MGQYFQLKLHNARCKFDALRYHVDMYARRIRSQFLETTNLVRHIRDEHLIGSQDGDIYDGRLQTFVACDPTS